MVHRILLKRTLGSTRGHFLHLMHIDDTEVAAGVAEDEFYVVEAVLVDWL